MIENAAFECATRKTDGMDTKAMSALNHGARGPKDVFIKKGCTICELAIISCERTGDVRAPQSAGSMRFAFSCYTSLHEPPLVLQSDTLARRIM